MNDGFLINCLNIPQENIAMLLLTMTISFFMN